MKSRILAVLFAVVLTAGTLAGCGSSKKADDTKAETTDEKSEDKASSDEDTKDVNVASEEEAEEAGFSVMVLIQMVRLWKIQCLIPARS